MLKNEWKIISLSDTFSDVERHLCCNSNYALILRINKGQLMFLVTVPMESYDESIQQFPPYVTLKAKCLLKAIFLTP